MSVLSQTKGFSKFHSYNDGQKGLFVQFESNLSLTGAKADTRYVIPSGYELVVALKLLEAIYHHPSSRVNKARFSQVEKITNKVFGPGNHRLSWNAKVKPSGIYFIRLEKWC